MRTTVTLPPAVHRRVIELAEARRSSLSAVVSDLVVRGLAQEDSPVELMIDPETGTPSLSIGRRITTDQVADLIDEDA